MPFDGNNPQGTAGGLDIFDLPQSPPVFVRAFGPMYILIMRTNGSIFERNRENVEDVIRVIGLRGESLAGFIVRHLGGVVEASATDVDFAEGFTVGAVAPGVVVIKIGTGDIVEIMIADGAVTLNKLAPDSVDASKIINGSVGTDELADLAVTAAKIANNTITAAQIAPDAIGASELADNSVDTNAIADLAVTTGKIDNLAVTAEKIANDTITATQIAPNAIGSSELADNAVDTNAVVNLAITTAKIANQAVSKDQLATPGGKNVIFFSSPQTAWTISNMPAADSELDTLARRLIDLSGVTEMRVTYLDSVAGAAAAKTYLKYDIGGGFLTLAQTAVQGELPMDGGLVLRSTGWISVAPGARVNNVTISPFGSGGDGVVDPQTRHYGVEFR